LTPLAQNVPFDKSAYILIINTVLFLGLALFSFFLSPKVEKGVYTVLLLISMLPGAMFLGYLLFASVLLETNSITSLFETNPEESKEFVMDYFNIWLAVGVLLYVIFPVVMILLMPSYRPLPVRKHKMLFFSSLVAILCVVLISRLSQSVYFINFYHTYVSYKMRIHKEDKAIPDRQKMAYDVRRNVHHAEPQTLVAVIGESLTRHHMQLYGYGRKTNPLLSAKGDSILVYADIVSPQVHTIPVIRSALSLSDRLHPEYFTEKPSLFELFNRAGYETYFISNQSFGGKYGTSYDALLNLAEHKYLLSQTGKNDEVVLPAFEQILETDSARNKLILIHLIGNHMAYKFRYSSSFNIFDHTRDEFVKEADYISEQAKTVIDQYDNSVAYNDYVIAGIIDLMRRKCNDNAAMVYFSDHGEELYDFRKFAGHAYEKVSAWMCEVPFIVWMPDGFKRERSDLVFDVNRPYSTADFVFSISDLAGLDFPDYDASRSIFSSLFIPRERFVGDIPYENLKEKANNNGKQ
ncbi:MAG: sulfatase-like hydrolase/transferase, partial [Prevotella sp.]|nr:sulfatase-like hydrolase/transferase [Prevotella sp.]